MPVSRCPEIILSLTRVPLGYFVVEPPADTITACPFGGRWATSSLQASSCSSESTAAAGGGTSWKSPSTETEKVPVLNPIWEPGTTGRVAALAPHEDRAEPVDQEAVGDV